MKRTAFKAKYNEPYDNDQLMNGQNFQRSIFVNNFETQQMQIYSYWDGINYSIACNKSSSHDIEKNQAFQSKLEQFEIDLNKMSSDIDIMEIIGSIKETKLAIYNLSKHVVKIEGSITDIKNNQKSHQLNTISNKKKAKCKNKAKKALKSQLYENDAISAQESIII